MPEFSREEVEAEFLKYVETRQDERLERLGRPVHRGRALRRARDGDLPRPRGDPEVDRRDDGVGVGDELSVRLVHDRRQPGRHVLLEHLRPVAGDDRRLQVRRRRRSSSTRATASGHSRRTSTTRRRPRRCSRASSTTPSPPGTRRPAPADRDSSGTSDAEVPSNAVTHTAGGTVDVRSNASARLRSSWPRRSSSESPGPSASRRSPRRRGRRRAGSTSGGRHAGRRRDRFRQRSPHGHRHRDGSGPRQTRHDDPAARGRPAGARPPGTHWPEQRRGAEAAVRPARRRASTTRDVQTSDFSISPVTTTTAGRSPAYEVTNTMTVTIHDLSKVGDIVDRRRACAGDDIVVNGLYVLDRRQLQADRHGARRSREAGEEIRPRSSRRPQASSSAPSRRSRRRASRHPDPSRVTPAGRSAADGPRPSRSSRGARS